LRAISNAGKIKDSASRNGGDFPPTCTRLRQYAATSMHFLNRSHFRFAAILVVLTGILLWGPTAAPAADPIGDPIVAYWNGPGTLLWGEHFGVLNDSAARQLVDAGFNLALANTFEEVQVAHAHGLRTLFQSELLVSASLDGGPKQASLDALIDRLRQLPAHYAYMLKDEPNASEFEDLGRLVDHLRRRDPDHLAYVNLLPNYANNQQLGADGYQDYLDRYTKAVRPSLLSYDHYQFTTSGDSSRYLLNLEAVARTAKWAGIPFLNVVQACTWDPPAMRVPNALETRFLIYTTLAYGSQGISYFQYTEADAPQLGGIVRRDGSPMPVYPAIKAGNHEFLNIVKQYRSMKWIGAYLKGYGPAMPPGAVPLPADSPFDVPEATNDAAYRDGEPLRGVLIGLFGEEDASPANATLALIVNLDYTKGKTFTLNGPADLSLFDATTSQWTATGRRQAKLDILPGGGVLVSLTSTTPGTPHAPQ
jgi:hypothetical protein